MEERPSCGPDGAKEDDGHSLDLATLEREMKLTRSPTIRALLVLAGTLSVALGTVGVFLPVLPTTPFLLLAAICYARSSKSFYVWLLTNRWFGAYIRDWRAGRGIPMRGKVLMLVTLGLGIGSSAIFFVPLVWAKVLLAVVGIAVGIHIWRMPTRRR